MMRRVGYVAWFALVGAWLVEWYGLLDKVLPL
jgi:hypothetical protein